MKITLFPCQGLNLLVPKQGFSHVTIHGFNEKKNYKNYHILVNARAAVVRTIPNTVNLHKFSAIISSDHRTITYCARSLRVAVHHPPGKKNGRRAAHTNHVVARGLRLVAVSVLNLSDFLTVGYLVLWT